MALKLGHWRLSGRHIQKLSLYLAENGRRCLVVGQVPWWRVRWSSLQTYVVEFRRVLNGRASTIPARCFGAYIKIMGLKRDCLGISVHLKRLCCLRDRQILLILNLLLRKAFSLLLVDDLLLRNFTIPWKSSSDLRVKRCIVWCRSLRYVSSKWVICRDFLALISSGAPSFLSQEVVDDIWILRYLNRVLGSFSRLYVLRVDGPFMNYSGAIVTRRPLLGVFLSLEFWRPVVAWGHLELNFFQHVHSCLYLRLLPLVKFAQKIFVLGNFELGFLIKTDTKILKSGKVVLWAFNCRFRSPFPRRNGVLRES